MASTCMLKSLSGNGSLFLAQPSSCMREIWDDESRKISDNLKRRLQETYEAHIETKTVIDPSMINNHLRLISNSILDNN
jgi:hypothetical protein